MAKGRQQKLVLAHLERVSGEVFEHYPTVLKELIRGKSGVYALYRNESLYYIGLASNLMSRVKTHLRDRHQRKWNRFSVYLTVHDDHMKELESLMLRIMRPRGNRQAGKFMASQNLRPVLSKAIKAHDADKRARLLGGRHTKRRVKSRSTSGRKKRVLAGLIDRATNLKAWKNGWEYSATLRKDGRIAYDGDIYETPSAAGNAATGSSVNGWRFWHYRENGEWVPLGKMRR